MSDVFKEYLIKQKKQPKDILAQAGIVVAALIVSCGALIFGGSFLGPILVCGIVYGAYYLVSRFNKEYEYILTNNELDIDVIYSRSSRKRVITIDLKRIDIMASIGDAAHKAELDKNYKLYNASNNAEDNKTYMIVGENDKYGTFRVKITPDESMLQDIYKQAPSKVFKY